MSGGVDSFVTALMLLREGYEVTGVTLDLWGESDHEEVQALCRQLGIGFVCWDGRKVFRDMVITSFAEGYISGMTPSPCCVCNRAVKWNLLLQAADSLGIFRIATGHYVRITRKDDYFYIRKGIDPRKDQSYFLWGVPQEVLKRAVTPLGGYTKAEVKEYAAANGYKRMAEKPESMGICFLEGRDYREFIAGWTGNKDVQRSGNILNREGVVVGQHSGILNYTVGQKRGLPLWNGQPLYVAEIDACTNTIKADVKGGLCKMSLEVEQVKVVCREDLLAGDVEIKIRGLGLNPSGYIAVTEKPDECVEVRLASDAWAVAPGQPVAFYRGDLLIGGGIVKK